MYTHEVIILGAGPAGTACALALGASGIRVALVDKAQFPRDKVCGDAVPARALQVLGNINPAIKEEFERFREKTDTVQTDFWVDGKKQLTLKWAKGSINCAREDFDNKLLGLTKRLCPEAEILTGMEPEALERDGEGVSLYLKNGLLLRARAIIGCDGVNSLTARQLAPEPLDRRHHGGAVRIYYQRIKGISPGVSEVHVQREKLPGYFWLFPLPHGRANVGFGMRSEDIARRKLRLRQLLPDFIASSPALSARFEKAIAEGPMEGAGLPFGSRWRQVAGERFLLAGDAAGLVDPLTGEGIGNAILSGRLAALQVQECLSHNDWSEKAMQPYIRALYNALNKEMRLHSRLQNNIARFPWLLNNPLLKTSIGRRMLQRMV